MLADLDSICLFIARDAPRYAELFAARVFRTTERLRQFPHSGRMVPEIGRDEIRGLARRQRRQCCTVEYGQRRREEAKTMAASIQRQVRLSAERVERLARLAQAHRLSEDEVIEKALDVLFSLTDVGDTPAERQGWSLLSEDSLRRVWDNDEDARYDNWQELYGAPAR